MNLKEKILSKKIVIVAGTGGVGKTTLSASIALYAAKAGKKTIVLTIDPAKRLAQALGLDTFDHRPKKVKLNGHSLTAQMLDTKETFDALIKKHAPSKDVAKKILNNRIYHFLSTTMAGTQDYMALEKLYELYTLNDYDLIVLDTPPSKHALSFLEAPDRLSSFFNENILKWFLKPYFLAGKISMSLFSKGSYIVFKFIEKFTGIGLLHDLSDFFLNLQTLFRGFRERTMKAKEILKSDETIFLLATNPDSVVLREALAFQSRLHSLNLSFGGVLMNRVADVAPLTEAEERTLERWDPQRESAFFRFQSLAKREREDINAFKSETSFNSTIAEIPFFADDIYDIKGLERIHPYIFK